MSAGDDGHGPARKSRDENEAAWKIDRALAEIQSSFEFLTLLAPNNVAEAWEEFRSGGYERSPRFDYPKITIDPDELHRRLSRLDLGAVEDPGLRYFLSAKCKELDLELALLKARNTPAFLALSMGLFGPVQQEYIRDAEQLLEELTPVEDPGSEDELDTKGIRKLAEEEIEYYRSRDSSFSCRIDVRPNQEGFLATGSDLLFPQEIPLEARRARALLQHEVGVHVVTHHNGTKQPLRLMASGLASYDELQEAFGTLAEYLVGGLSPVRMRSLAARVIAARMAEERANFIDAFRRLTRDFGFGAFVAFEIVSRVHSCGGLTRDQIYLRGLVYLLRYLRAGGELEPLYLGKVGHEEIPVIQDLQRRGVLREPPLRPRFLEMEEARDRLDAVRRGLSLRDLVQESPPREEGGRS
jgi:uncharacterized protein (TIGR02421 family)